MIVGPALAVWLYGSYARGDADELSDLDVLVISECETDQPALRRVLGVDVEPSVSRYSWDEIDRMAQYGSLFLRHVDLEGHPVFESVAVRGRLGHILSGLGPYLLASRDLRGFRTVLRDVRESLDSGEAPLLFELSTLATLFRHASVLGCSLAGSPCFSRTQPVRRLVELWELPRNWGDDFPPLYAFRLHAENRPLQVPTPSTDLAYLWCERTRALLDELRKWINDSH